MPSTLSREDEFLVEEYKAAGQLTYHIDTLRNTLTGFFLTFAGIATAALTLLLKGEAREVVPIEPQRLVGGLLLVVALVGVCVVVILARLRAAQLEHFRIINNIRTYFIGHNKELWNVVQLSGDTLPRGPTRKSGTYFWLVLILFVTSTIFVAGAGLISANTRSVHRPPTSGRDTVSASAAGAAPAPLGSFDFTLPLWGALGLFAGGLLLGDQIYMTLAKPRDELEYEDPYPFRGRVKKKAKK